MKKIKNSTLFVMLFSIVTFAYFSIGLEAEPIENLNIEAGAGFHIEKGTGSDVTYILPRCVYIFKQNTEPSSIVYTSRGTTLGATREESSIRSSKREIRGQEKALVISEAQAMYGIHPIIDILFKNPDINDKAVLVICKGDPTPILEHKFGSYPSSSDYIEELVKSSKDFNFFSEDFNGVNIFVRLDSEGRNVVLPYIEIRENNMEITGAAVFKQDKLATKLNMQDTKLMNLLRTDRGKGLMSMQDNSKHFIDFYGKSKRKVKCVKTGDKYNFTIDIELTGTTVTNELYKDIQYNLDEQKKFEKDLAKSVEQQCNDFVNRMKYEFKVDCLELGRTAAATYGRRKVANWDDEISKSNIKVNVNVIVENHGRGDY